MYNSKTVKTSTIRQEIYKMSHYELKTSVWVPVNRLNVFELFSDAFKLEPMTPPFLGFAVVTPPPIEMSVGRLIDYKLRLHGFPIRWQTRITNWEPPARFEDSQVRGPYSMWVHTHTFTEIDGGTLMCDAVRYSAIGGALVHRLCVKRDLQRIFEYRQKRLPDLLGIESSGCRFEPIEIRRAAVDSCEDTGQMACTSK
jgi:ligand-binding SRPBCC domain-containing protein